MKNFTNALSILLALSPAAGAAQLGIDLPELPRAAVPASVAAPALPAGFAVSVRQPAAALSIAPPAAQPERASVSLRRADRPGLAAAVFDNAQKLSAAQDAVNAVSGADSEGGDVGKARLSLAQRTAYFRSPAFRDWVASEKALGRQVFWLKDIDKTQAAGDSFTYFFQWRAEQGKITQGQNDVIKRYLKTLTLTDPALRAEVAKADSNDAKANATLVIKLWRSKEHGGDGIGLLDFWSNIYWPTQKGLTQAEKLAQAAAFAPEYAKRVYPGIPEDNAALTEAGVEVVAVSNGDQELAQAVAAQLGLKPENIVGSNLVYGPDGLATGVNHAYEIFDKDWTLRPQPGKHLAFHYWANKNKARWGWQHLDKRRVVIAGADGDSASSDGGMWAYFPDKAIGNFMIDTPHEPNRLPKSRDIAAKYGWGAGQFYTLIHSPDSKSDWDDVPPQR